MQDPNRSDNPNHARHDVTLIAGHAAGDLVDSERDHAQALLDSCGQCADLHRDLAAIAEATRTLPALATAPRDFRLDPAQAERLRRGSWLRAALRPFATARSATRPMAAAFTSLGLAGLLVATVVPGLLGSAASAPSREMTAAGNEQASQAPAPAPVGAAGAPSPATVPGAQDLATANPDTAYGVKNGPTPTIATEGAMAGGPQPTTEDQADGTVRLNATASPPNLLLVGSLALLLMGVILFGLRFAARRVR